MERICMSDDNFKFDKIGRKLSKQVENAVGKGEIARYEQFLLFLQCFQKACFPGGSKVVIVWEWVNHMQRNKIHFSVLSNLCRYCFLFCKNHETPPELGFGMCKSHYTGPSVCPAVFSRFVCTISQ